MNIKGVFVLIIASLFYAGAIVINRLALTTPGVDVFQYSLFTIALLALLSIAFVVKDRKAVFKMSWKEWLMAGIIGILASGVNQLLFIFGQAKTPAVNAGFISSLSTPFTAIFAVLMIRHRMSLTKWLWALIAFIGVAVMTTNLNISTFNQGDLFILIAMAIIGFTNVLASIAMKNVGGAFISYLRILFGALFVIIVAAIIKKMFVVSGILPVWRLLLIGGLLTFGFFVLFYVGIQLTNPTVATVIYMSSVVFTSILAVIFLKEFPSWIQWIGGACGLFAIIMFVTRKS